MMRKRREYEILEQKFFQPNLEIDLVLADTCVTMIAR